MIGAVVGVGAILAAGTFAFTQLRSNAGDGGAASPQAVGEQLLQSIENEDALGAVDLLLPGERETFRQPLVELFSELGRLGVVEDKVNLNQVNGFDLTVDNPSVSVTDTNVNDISNVTVKGRIQTVTDGKKVPIGDLLIQEAFNGERPNLDSDETSDLDLKFASVRKDGRWYVSLMYTAAESSRGSRDIPKNGVTPLGAKDPIAAVDNLFQSLSDLRLEDAIANLNPNEAEALQRYAPLFLDDAQRSVDKAGLVWSISDTEYSVSGEGDTRYVAIKALSFKAQVDGQQSTVDVTIKDDCITGSFGDTKMHSCVGDLVDPTNLAGLLDQAGITDDGAIGTLIKDVQSSFSDLSLRGITVKKVGASWYVSPIAAYFDVLLAELRALDRGELETLIADVRAVIASIVDQFSGSFDTTGDGSYWGECLYGDDPQGCIQAGVADGTFVADEIQAAYLYPQCGLFDYYNGGDLYNDSAADFHAKIVAGADCITQAADADGIDLSYASQEFLRPECYLEVNPYNYSDESISEQQRTASYDCLYN